MKFELKVLGTNAAMPSPKRNTTAQVLNIQENHFLIDCGEGTQIQMERFQVKRSKIDHLFISHLHGDHYFGLWGLLTSFSLNAREKALNIYSPPGLEALIMPALKYGNAQLGFDLNFIAIDPSQNKLIFENKVLEVYSIPLHHRIPTSGYLFVEKERPRKMISEQISAYQLSIAQIIAAKSGADIQLEDGRLIPNAELTTPAPKVRSFAFCSDTRYSENIIPIIKGVDLLYHESTFCHEDLERAEKTMHSTALEAARIAKKAGAGKLILGHFSARYENIKLFEKEAKSVFPNSIAPSDGDSFELPFV